MAKWIGSEPPPFVGTKDGITVYQLQDDQYFVRMQSSITAKRIKKDKAFARFRDSSQRLRIASRIASAIYRQFTVKEYPLYREMTGKAILWLKEGCAVELIEAKLQQAYQSKCAVKEAESNGSHASEVKQPCTRVVVKALFRIPDILKTGFDKTMRKHVRVKNKNNPDDIHLVLMDFINKSHQHAYQ
jgi:hypothetical protein